MQSPVYTYSFSTPRSDLNIFCPPSPHQYLFFPFLSCFQPFLLASWLTRTWGVMRHQTAPACLSCNARIKQRSGKLICFPRCSFVTWWDRHWDIQSMGMKLVEKQKMSKAGRWFFFSDISQRFISILSSEITYLPLKTENLHSLLLI